MLGLLIPKKNENRLEKAFRRAMTGLTVIFLMAAAAPPLAVALVLDRNACDVQVAAITR